MHPCLAAKAAAQGAVFSAAQARDCGYTAEQIKRLRMSGEWMALRRGIYAEGAVARDADDTLARHRLVIAAAILATAGRGVASHWSASILHGLQFLKEPSLEVVRLTQPNGRAIRQYPGLRITRASLPANHVTDAADLRVTSIARTVVDLARELPFRDGVVVTDSALRLTETSKADMERVLRDCWNWPGVARASRVVAFSDARSQAVSESLARVVFLEVGLPTPIPQFPVYDGQQLVGFADFGWPDCRTVGEIDGKVKYALDRTGDEEPISVVWKEKRREDRMREAGFEVVRLSVGDLYERQLVRAAFLAAFARGMRRAG